MVFAADDCGVGIAPVQHVVLSVSDGICGAANIRVFAIQSARGSPDWVCTKRARVPFEEMWDRAPGESRATRRVPALVSSSDWAFLLGLVRLRKLYTVTI